MMPLTPRFLAVILLVALVASCHKETVEPVDNPLASLPKDTGGTHVAHVLGSDSSPYGYLLYTPSGYASTGPKFPLLIFLHGSGEIGNSQITPTALNSIKVYGPPLLIEQGKWNPVYPMVVASAQCHDGWWDLSKVRQFIEFMMNNYQVDTSRIYLTGLSMGGYATYDQLMFFGADSHLAAAIPICGSGTFDSDRVHRAADIPIWSFHGEDDHTVSPDFSKAFIKAINETSPAVKAKLTLYPGVGHDSWTETYSGSGMGKEDPSFDPFNEDVFKWLLEFKRP